MKIYENRYSNIKSVTSIPFSIPFGVPIGTWRLVTACQQFAHLVRSLYHHEQRLSMIWLSGSAMSCFKEADSKTESAPSKSAQRETWGIRFLAGWRQQTAWKQVPTDHSNPSWKRAVARSAKPECAGMSPPPINLQLFHALLRNVLSEWHFHED